MTTLDPSNPTSSRPPGVGGTAPTAQSTLTAASDPPTRWYWLAGMLALLGLVGAVVWGGFRLLGAIEAPRDFVRAPIPGAVTVTVPGSTTQVVYVEGNRPLAIAALDLTVTGPTGAAVPATTYRQQLQYDVPDRNGRVGTAVASFRADAAGAYRLSTTAAGLEPGATLAVGGDLARNAVGRLIGPGVLGLGAVAVAVLVAVTAARRARTRHLWVSRSSGANPASSPHEATTP